jgi:hypothetical protein
MAAGGEVRLNFKVDPLQEVDKPLRKRLTEDYEVRLSPIEVKEEVVPGNARWDAKRIEQKLRGSYNVPLKILATTAYDMDKEVQKATNGRDRQNAVRALVKKLDQSHRNLARTIKEYTAEVLEEVAGPGNPDAEKTMKAAGRELASGAGADTLNAIDTLLATFQTEIAGLERKLRKAEEDAKARAEKLARGGRGRGEGDEEEESRRRGRAEEDEEMDGPPEARRLKLVNACVAALRAANETFEGVLDKAVEEGEADVEKLRQGAKNPDIGDSNQAALKQAAGELDAALKGFAKAYRDTKTGRDKAVRHVMTCAPDRYGEATDHLPRRGGRLAGEAEALDKLLDRLARKLGQLARAAKG